VSDFEEQLGSLFSSAAIVFSGRVLERGLALFGQILIIRSLAPDVFGDIAVTYTVVGTVSTFLALGLYHGVTRTMSSKETASERIAVLLNGVYIVLFSGALGVVGIYLFRSDIARLFDNPTIDGLLILFLPIAFFGPLSKVIESGLRSLKNTQETIFFRDILSRILALVALGVFVILGDVYTGAIVYWNVLPVLIVVLLLYLCVGLIRNNGGIVSPSMELMKQLISFSWPLAISGSIIILMRNLDIFMIAYFLDANPVGLYRAIQGLNAIPLFILQSFVFLYLPLATEAFSNDKTEDLGRLYTASTRWISLVTFPIAAIVVFFSDDVIRVLFSEQYVPASLALSILVGGVFVRALAGPNGATINAIGKSKVEMISGITGLVANFAFNILLIPQFGIEGAALATGAGFFVYNGVEVGIIYWITGVHPFSVKTFRALLPSTIVVGAFAAWTSNIQFGIGLLSLVGVAVGLLTVVSVIMTGAFDEIDLLLLNQLEESTGKDFDRLRVLIIRAQ